MKILRGETVAWLAGLYEGEGSCSLNTSTNAWIVAISGKDFDVIRRIHDETGIGVLYVRPRTEQPQWKPLLTWSVAKQRDVIDVLTAIRPWLGDRRTAQIDHCLADLSQRTRPPDGMCKGGRHPKLGAGPCRECQKERSRRYRARLAAGQRSSC